MMVYVFFFVVVLTVSLLVCGWALLWDSRRREKEQARLAARVKGPIVRGDDGRETVKSKRPGGLNL